MSKYLLFFIIGNLLLVLLVYLTRKRKGIGHFRLVAALLFLTFSLVEIGYRYWKAKGDYFAKVDSPMLFRRDSLMGAEPDRPGKFSSVRMTSGGDTVFHAVYTIIADSGRNPLRMNHRVGYLAAGAPEPKIIFLGCSYTFGQGVNDTGTLAWRLGALRGVSTLNLGGMGYGIHHVYEIFRKNYADRNDSGKLFVYTLVPEHVLRAAGVDDYSGGPSFAMVGDSLVYNGALSVPDNRIAYYSSLFGRYTFIEDMVGSMELKKRVQRVSGDEYEKAYVMVKNMSRSAERTGGHFLLLFWDAYNPASSDANLRFRPLLENAIAKLRRDGVDVVRASEILDINNPALQFPNDGHPRAMVYDTVARYLARRPGLFR